MSPRSKVILGRSLFALALLPGSVVLLAYLVAISAVLNRDIDRAAGMAAGLLFLVCAPASLFLMLLASRFTESRWPVRVVLIILGLPLIAMLSYFFGAAVWPSLSNG
jgi:hypothetical protein